MARCPGVRPGPVSRPVVAGPPAPGPLRARDPAAREHAASRRAGSLPSTGRRSSTCARFEDDQRAARIKGQLTEEEHLGKVLSQIGPFVAVGRPGEAVPAVGAARVYLGDAEWQSTVEDLLRTARLVLIRTGRTTGLEWELARAVRLVPPERLVLVVDSAQELRDQIALIRSVHPNVLPRLRMGWHSISSVRGFIMFDAEWRARSCGRSARACIFSAPPMTTRAHCQTVRLDPAAAVPVGRHAVEGSAGQLAAGRARHDQRDALRGGDRADHPGPVALDCRPSQILRCIYFAWWS